jgi:hypothetical protein
MKSLIRNALVIVGLFALSQYATAQPDDVFFTMGVHNNLGCNADNGNCIADRAGTDPSDPFFPAMWVSDWTMYRVRQNYEKNPPPYSSPPST